MNAFLSGYLNIKLGGISLTHRLNKQAKLLLFVFALFSFSSLLSGTFVPIFLWKNSQSYFYLGSYICAQYLSSGLLFYVFGQAAKHGKKRRLLQLGALCAALFYAVILLIRSHSYQAILFLGCLYGFALALFWLAYNVFYFEITDAENRDHYNGWQGMLVAGCGIIAPWLSSRLIVSLGAGVGYRVIFICSFILYAIIIVISVKLEKRAVKGVYDWSFPIKMFFKQREQYRALSYAIMAQGVREGMFVSLLPFIIYIATNSEGQIGYYTLVTSFIAFISNYFIGKRLKANKRMKAMLLGACGSWLAIFLILLHSGFTGLMWFGGITALIWPFFVIPFTSMVFDQIGKTQEAVEHKEEFIVFRELALMIGRLIGLIPFFIYAMWLYKIDISIGWLLLLVGLAPLLSVFFMKKVSEGS